MSFRIVRGKECDPKGIFSRYLSSNPVSDCINNAFHFIQHNHLDEWMDCFSLKQAKSEKWNVLKRFYWHDWECGLPMLI